MVFLNHQYQTFRNLMTTMLWVMRWFMATLSETWEWMGNSALPWAGGYWANISGGVVRFSDPADTSGLFGSGCAFWDIGCDWRNFRSWVEENFNKLWDRFTGAVEAILWFLGEILSRLGDFITSVAIPFVGATLEFIVGVFNLALDLGKAILAAIVYLIVQVVMMLIFAADLIVTLITAWNAASPEAIPGLTVCDPENPNHVICWFYWAAEHTLFAGDIGSLLIPLLTFIGFVVMAIRFVQDIRKTFMVSASNT